VLYWITLGLTTQEWLIPPLVWVGEAQQIFPAVSIWQYTANPCILPDYSSVRGWDHSLSPKQMALCLGRSIRHATAYEGYKMKFKEERVRIYDENPNLCIMCNKVLFYKQRKNKFCSLNCSATYNNKGCRRNVTTGTFAKKPCARCKCITKYKFCSRVCYDLYVREERISQAKATGILNGSPVTIKKCLIEIRGKKCEICCTEKWCGKEVPLVLDHINGKPKDCRIENLRLVCGNCNMQLPTFAGRNVGKGGGRPYRMKRYYAGESY